jgi:hypothetical protein
MASRSASRTPELRSSGHRPCCAPLHARRPALSTSRAPDAGALVRGPHSARLLRHGVRRARAVRGVAVLADRRSALPRARHALVEGDARAVRGRRRHGHDPELRARAPVAGLHGCVRRRVRPGVRARGLLVLRRGDLHRDLRLRMGEARAARALPVGNSRGAHRDGGVVLRDRGRRLDAASRRILTARRPRRRRRAVVRAVRQSVPLAHVGAHVLRRVRRRWLPRRGRVCVGRPAPARGALRADRAGHLARSRCDRLAAAAGDR